MKPAPTPRGAAALPVVLAVVLAPAAGAGAAPLAAQTIALRGGTVHTAAGPAIPNGTVVIRDGKIAAVGRDVSVPADARVIDVAGKEVLPGFIDNHSHIGTDPRDLNDRWGRFTPRLRMMDVLSFDERYWNDAVEGGVTTIVTGPGSGEVSSGQAVVVKTWGADPETRVLKPFGGLKIAMGRKSPDMYPSTSMAVTSYLRTQFQKAREYMDAWKRWDEGDKKGQPPTRDLDMEALARVLRKEQKVRSHVHSAHDILGVLRLKDEFGFDLVLHHSTEAYKVADEIARRGVEVVGMPLAVRIGVGEEIMRSPALFASKGIRFAFHTDDPVVHSKWQRLNASLGIRYGMSEEAALRALTIDGARIAGVGDRVGSIEPGKDADLVVVEAPWYELTSRVELVLVDGRVAYDRAQEGGR